MLANIENLIGNQGGDLPSEDSPLKLRINQATDHLVVFQDSSASLTQIEPTITLEVPVTPVKKKKILVKKKKKSSKQ